MKESLFEFRNRYEPRQKDGHWIVFDLETQTEVCNTGDKISNVIKVWRALETDNFRLRLG